MRGLTEVSTSRFACARSNEDRALIFDLTNRKRWVIAGDGSIAKREWVLPSELDDDACAFPPWVESTARHPLNCNGCAADPEFLETSMTMASAQGRAILDFICKNAGVFPGYSW